ncbi:MAG TPA: hypothetical protein VGQ26_27035, partial [Streptosporangiaceae bacterium]|nr:hypothetical protein [Streptosporangiaceae bacterium]
MSTSSYVCREGEVIRHNFGWTLVILGYLILIGLFYCFVLPEAMRSSSRSPGSSTLCRGCRGGWLFRCGGT